ncbi:hypothetical protein [Methylocaldum sp. RMAD-M]|uniref:hypothetical protein n=1 Tax=Methylocaldum sp. RMAD-M TaxID=2806557 RepID=UPI00111BD9C6|nr:hypothetical protein [Methylocaldum sp. RMAD-M]MBP1151267.1 hypothetical protein [Methylocaldum sp. RMAD-M]
MALTFRAQATGGQIVANGEKTADQGKGDAQPLKPMNPPSEDRLNRREKHAAATAFKEMIHPRRQQPIEHHKQYKAKEHCTFS